MCEGNSTIGLFDNHTHLDLVSGEMGVSVDAVLQDARDAGVLGVVTVGCDVESSFAQVKIASKHPGVRAVVAIHPGEVHKYHKEQGRKQEHKQIKEEMAVQEFHAPIGLSDALLQIENLARQETRKGGPVVGIGETGLDFYRCVKEDAYPLQRKSFLAHLELARDLDIPVQIHCRDAFAEVLECMKSFGFGKLPRVVFHCFSGDADFALFAKENGWYMSFAGNVTFKNAKNLQQVLPHVPLGLLLLETDAPYLTPHPNRGKTNSPKEIVHTAQFIADYLKVDYEVIVKETAKNIVELYGRFGFYDAKSSRDGTFS